MTAATASLSPARQYEHELVSEILHALSQPLTALECGLEMSLRQDKTVQQLRCRMATLLATAQTLHQRLLEVRALQDAGEAGDTFEPVALDSLLLQLREDFVPLAASANVKLGVKCRPGFVGGNAARLRNGFFQLFEFLLRNCASGGEVRVVARETGADGWEVRFRTCGAAGSTLVAPLPAANPRDLALRIAQRTFQSVGGSLELRQRGSGQIGVVVRLRRAK